jgi:hypothetical protein
MAIRFKDTISINEEYTFPLQDGTVNQVLSTDGAGVISFVDLPDGEAVKIACKNTTASTITKGTPVYITGTVGSSFIVQIAPADSANAAKMPASGLLETDLAPNGEGFVVTGGLLKNLITDPIDGSTPSTNQTIYVKPGGGLTLTKPTGSNLIQNIGKVGRVNSSSAGSIIVSSILRTNDVPNLTEGKIWVGSANNTIESTVVHIDETNTRVGIGTVSPVSLFNVAKGSIGEYMRVGGDDASNNRALTFSSSTTSSIGDTHTLNAISSNGVIAFATASQERIRITSGGLVGIGETNPDALLHLKSTNSFIDITNDSDTGDAGILFRTTTNVNKGYVIYDFTNDKLNFRSSTSGSGVDMTIDGTGNVGIGTTSPAAKLDVEGGDLGSTSGNTTTAAIIRAGRQNIVFKDTRTANGSDWNNATFKIIAQIDSTDHQSIDFVNASNYAEHIDIRTGNQVFHSRFTSDGKLGIGTSSPGSKLHINDGALQFDKTNASSGGDFDFIKIGYNGSWGNNQGGIAGISVDDGVGIVGRYGITYYASDGGGRFVVSDLYDSGYGASGDVFYVTGTGIAQAQASFRAPIFYDSNDTNYYMDPSSTSAAGLRAASGELVSLYQASWTFGPSHYVLYNAWTSGTGDYLLVKGSGNQSGGNGAIIIGEGAVYYGQHGNAQAAIDSATAPLATNWGYLNSQGLHIGNDSNHYIGRNVTKTRIQSQYGYIDIGAGNSTYAHITTDRSYFYMDRTINFDGNILGYGGDETASFATYYDSNNTSYYINPADATSVRVAGFVDGGPNSAFRLFDGTDFRGGVGDGQWASGNASYTNDLAVYATANINFHTSNGNTPEMILTSSGLSIGSNIGAYIAEATGNYGTYRCEGVLGSSGTWAGWAIRDDWVFMSNGSAVAGIYNDTNNEWSVYCEQNARTILYYNGTAQVETQNGYLLAPNQMRAPIYYDSNDTTYYTNPAGDSYDLGLSRALAEVAGWVVSYGGYNENYAQWIETEDATQLYGYGDTSVGMVHRARRVKSGQTVRFTITLKSSVAVTSGLYLRLQVYNGNLPDGKTHVSNAASSSSPFVQEDSSQITSWYENGALGTSWQTEYFEYTATADCYISLLVLNWTGAGTARFYVKTPDIQTVGTPSGTTYTNLYYASDTNYGLIGNDAYFDTVDSGLTTDPLELVYSRGTEVRIGPNGGDKAIKASVFYEGTNTAYYCDPASTSRFVTTTTNYANITSGNAYAVRFWGGSHNYSIRMSTSADSTYGGRVAGETTSDYNMYFTMQAGTNRGFVFRSSNSSSSVVAGIDASGNGRFIGDVVAYSSSDERLKDNKKNIDNALEKVESLNGVEFDWNDKQDVYSGHDVGIIAQEVEKVLPEIVTDRENGYKAVKYEKLVPLLIEAVKELSEKVKMLENK